MASRSAPAADAAVLVVVDDSARVAGGRCRGMALKRRAPAPTATFGGTARLDPDIAADRPRTRLGDILVDQRAGSPRETVENAIERAPARRLGETLIADGLLDEVTLARAIGEQSGRRGRRHPRAPGRSRTRPGWCPSTRRTRSTCSRSAS